jgi:DNA-binding MarR family transcriptional regulator
MDAQQAGKYADQLLEQVTAQMGRVRRPLNLSKEIPPSQASLLLGLDAQGPLRVADIAERMNITSPGASSLVNEIVKAGWATRSEHPEDRRIKMIEITEAGRAVATRFNQRRRDMVMAVLKHFEPAEIEPFIATIAKLVLVIDQELDKQ